MSEALKQLEKDFIRVEQLAEFLGVSVAWLKLKDAEGLINLKKVGVRNYFAYVPEVTEAIKEGMLSPGTGRKHEQRKRTMAKRNPMGPVRERRSGLGGKGKSKGQRRLQDILVEKTGEALG